MSPEDQYKEIESTFKRLSGVMTQTVSSYYIWSTLTFARSTAEVGEVANKNVEIISFHKYFFNQVERALLNSIILGLNKFFDKDQRAVSFKTLIAKLDDAKDVVNADTLLNVYPDRFKPGDHWLKDYVVFEDTDVSHLNNLYEESVSVLTTLKDIRDKTIAHEDFVQPDTTFVPLEIEKLIDHTQEIFNKLQSKACLATTDWRNMKDSSIHDTNTVISNLIRGEAERKREIYEEL